MGNLKNMLVLCPLTPINYMTSLGVAWHQGP